MKPNEERNSTWKNSYKKQTNELRWINQKNEYFVVHFINISK